VGHRPLEVDIDRVPVRAGERGEVDGNAAQLAMHPVGDEGRERSQQPARHEENFVEGGKSGAVVVLVHLIEP
jgi:hypothetical protein